MLTSFGGRTQPMGQIDTSLLIRFQFGWNIVKVLVDVNYSKSWIQRYYIPGEICGVFFGLWNVWMFVLAESSVKCPFSLASCWG